MQTIDIGGKKVKLQIWDTAGQERFRTITQSYFRGAQGILLVFDVMDRAAFNNVRTWMESIDQHADRSVNRILIGNKCDMPDRVRARSGAAPLEPPALCLASPCLASRAPPPCRLATPHAGRLARRG